MRLAGFDSTPKTRKQNVRLEIYVTRGRHAVLPTRGGKPKEAKIIKRCCRSRSFVGTSFFSSVLRKFLARKKLQGVNATHCFTHSAGKRKQAKNHKKFLTVALLRRNLVLLKCSSKISCKKKIARRERHALCHAQGGEANTRKKS